MNSKSEIKIYSAILIQKYNIFIKNFNVCWSFFCLVSFKFFLLSAVHSRFQALFGNFNIMKLICLKSTSLWFFCLVLILLLQIRRINQYFFCNTRQKKMIDYNMIYTYWNFILFEKCCFYHYKLLKAYELLKMLV